MRIESSAIPFDSVVVVIGANGFMGVETCYQVLDAGFRVRGTVRDIQKNAWMHDLFDDKWPGKFELVRVADFTADGAFDEAFNGATGVIYVSTPVLLGSKTENVIDPIVKGIINTLETAARAGINRYVYSSSSKGVEDTQHNTPHVITEETFNYAAIDKVEQGPVEETPERYMSVYCASRAAGELAFWDWVRKNDAPFVANVVVPDGQFGRVLDPVHANIGLPSSLGMIKQVFAGETEGVILEVGYLADVQDTARLFIAALVFPEVKNERIFAYYLHFTWNELRRRVRELYPDRTNIITGSDLNVTGRDIGDARGVIARAEKLLQKLGQPSFTTMDSTLRDIVESFYPAKA